MITARQKRKENIVEYLLYMWQVEDMIRACRLDMDIMEERIISKYDQPEEAKRRIRLWYQELAKMQGKAISVETQDGIKQISHFLTFLAFRFHEEENLS